MLEAKRLGLLNGKFVFFILQQFEVGIDVSISTLIRFLSLTILNRGAAITRDFTSHTLCLKKEKNTKYDPDCITVCNNLYVLLGSIITSWRRKIIILKITCCCTCLRIIFLFQNSFLEEALSDEKNGSGLENYQSVFVIGLRSYGGRAMYLDFVKQVWEKLKEQPFSSSLSSEEKVWCDGL